MFMLADFKEKQLDQVVMREIIFKGAEEAPLMAALMARGRVLDAPGLEVTWFDTELPGERTQINNGGAAYDAAATTLVVDDASIFPAGYLIYAEATGERMYVVSSNGTTQIVVVRGFAGTTAHANSVANDAYLRNAGQVSPEGSQAPAATHRTKGEYTNYCQHFKETAGLSGTADRSAIKTEDELAEQTMEKTKLLMRNIERSLKFGAKAKNVVTANGTIHTMGGLLSNLSFVDNVAGTLSKARFNSFFRTLFTYGGKGPERTAFAGPTVHDAIHTIFENKLQTRSGETAAGLQLTRIYTPSGPVNLIQDFSLRDGFADYMIGVDLDAMRLRPMPGMMPHVRPVVQTRNADVKENEVQAQLTLEFGSPAFHGVMKGVTGPG